MARPERAAVHADGGPGEGDAGRRGERPQARDLRRPYPPAVHDAPGAAGTEGNHGEDQWLMTSRLKAW